MDLSRQFALVNAKRKRERRRDNTHTPCHRDKNFVFKRNIKQKPAQGMSRVPGDIMNNCARELGISSRDLERSPLSVTAGGFWHAIRTLLEAKRQWRALKLSA